MKNKTKFFIFFAFLIAIFLLIIPNTVEATVNHTADEAIEWCKSVDGTSIDMDGYPSWQPYQCVDLIRAYYVWMGKSQVAGNGEDYAWNALPDGFTRIQGAQPQKGDILIYSASEDNGNCGHVAIYDSDWSTYHQNYGGASVIHWTTKAYTGFGPYWGVIRPDFKKGDTEPPKFLTETGEIVLSSITSTSVKVRIKATDNVGISYIDMGVATPTEDFTWGNHMTYNSSTGYYEGTVTSNGRSTKTGLYTVHLYAFDAAGNSAGYAFNSIPMGMTINKSLGNFTARIVYKSNSNYAIGLDGTKAILKSKSEDDLNQVWKFTKQSNNTYQILNVATGKSLDVKQASDVDGTDIIVYENGNGTNQRFYIMNFNGGYRIIPACSLQCKGIDLANGSPSNGAKIQLWKTESYTQNAQTWTFEAASEKIKVKSITLDITSMGMTEEGGYTLQPTVLPANATDKTLTWSSSNTSVATVSSNGFVVARSAGTAIITAKANDGSGVSATCTIGVTARIRPQSISLSENDIVLKVGETKSVTATITPSNVNSKLTLWKSDNSEIAEIQVTSPNFMSSTNSGEAWIYNLTGTIKGKKEGTTTVSLYAYDNKDAKATCKVTVLPDVIYTTHVQNIGWQSYVKNGEMAGTSGKSYRLEGIKIKLDNATTSGGITYSTHVQNIGWQEWKKDNEMAGTSGKSYRLEAIKIKLTGEMANKYDVYYRVHAQEFGWLDWAKNGAEAGTAGYSYRLEGIQIKLVKKGGAAPGTTARAFVQSPVRVVYTTHVQNEGWQKEVRDGVTSGTIGKGLRLEGIRMNLENTGLNGLTGGISYRTHIQNIGWQDWKENNAMSGTNGKSLRLEAIQIKLTGKVAEQYDVYYRVQAQNLGWLGWAKNGASAGTAGYSYRLEAIQIKLVKKGGAAPGSTANAFKSK